MEVEIEFCRLVWAMVAVEGSVFDHRGVGHSLCSGREGFVSGVDSRVASGFLVGRSFDLMVPRYRREGESDFVAATACDDRTPEKGTGQLDQRDGSFHPLGGRQIWSEMIRKARNSAQRPCAPSAIPIHARVVGDGPARKLIRKKLRKRAWRDCGG